MPEQESKKDRVDRELIELPNRAVYLAALLASAPAGALLIAPSVYHRLNFRQSDKQSVFLDSNLLLIVGSYFAAIWIVCSIFLIGEVLFRTQAALLATIATIAVYAALWVVLPLARRTEEGSGPRERGD